MKLKITIKIIIFILLFVISLSAVTGVFVTVDRFGLQNITGFYEEPEDSLDAVYIGSSNCFCFWNSLVAWEEYGISVYPYACNSNLFYSTEYLIKEAKKTQPNAVFIVNINSLTDGEVNLKEFRNLIDSMPFSLNKLALIKHLADVGDYSFEDSLEFYLPIIRYHSRWNIISKSDFNTKLDRLKGAGLFDVYLERIEDVSGSYVTTDKKAELVDKLVSSTESLLDYCDEEKVKVVFVTVPQSRGNEYDMSRYNALNELISKRGYPVLDLTEKIDEMDINLSTDYYNGHHTNIHGSIKFTYYLSEYLIKNYGFKDKRQEKAYSSWNDAYKRYAESIAPYVIDFELDSEHRDFTLMAPNNLKASANKSTVTVSWERVSGADGYAVYRRIGNGAWSLINETVKTNYLDTPVNKKNTYYYTVVPYKIVDGEKIYGNYLYNGIKVNV